MKTPRTPGKPPRARNAKTGPRPVRGQRPENGKSGGFSRDKGRDKPFSGDKRKSWAKDTPRENTGHGDGRKQGSGRDGFKSRGKTEYKKDFKPGFGKKDWPARGDAPAERRERPKKFQKRAENRPARHEDRPNGFSDGFKGNFKRGFKKDSKGGFDRQERRPRPERSRPEHSRPERTHRETRLSANIFGLHAVRAAWLNPKRSVHAIYLSAQAAQDLAPVAEQARAKGLKRPEPKILDKEEFDRLAGRDSVHQGAAMSAAPQEEVFVSDMIAAGLSRVRSVILVLDQVTDPHNVGAILRSACAFGADGVVMQRRHAPELEGVLAKTASGAAEYIPVAYETNLSRALEDLAAAGYRVIGLDEHSQTKLADITVPERAVLVLGAEGEGMRRLVREHCDVLATLPTKGPVASLNVSNAAAIALYALLK